MNKYFSFSGIGAKNPDGNYQAETQIDPNILNESIEVLFNRLTDLESKIRNISSAVVDLKEICLENNLRIMEINQFKGFLSKMGITILGISFGSGLFVGKFIHFISQFI